MKTFVKICGLTNIEDAMVAVDAGADLLGFILYPKSPRYVSPQDIAQIVKAVRAAPHPAHPIRTVGVFVDVDEQTIKEILAETKLDLVQLHGDEDPESQQAFDGQSYKALRPSDAAAAKQQVERYAPFMRRAENEIDQPRWLLDAYEPGMYGGTGKRADWKSAAQLAQAYPGLLLAGGLSPENVSRAIDVVQPWGVDVASGVERAPGKKDHDAVREFIRAVRSSHNSNE